jgi:flagellar biosynthesis/type III secretory pathway protein FliH
MISSSVRPDVLPDGTAAAVADAWYPNDLSLVLQADGTASGPDPMAEAYALGFEEGRHEGEVAEQARLHGALRASEQALDVIRANEQRWSDSIDENIVALAIAVARHVVDRELAIDRTVVGQLVLRALDDFPIDQPVRIRVNPNDLLVLDAHGTPSLDELAGAPGRVAHWVPDARIASGGCVVEGRDRIIDGRVETALERLYRRLTYQNA